MTAIEFESCFSFICLTLPWNVRSVCMILQHHRCADFESITPLCLLWLHLESHWQPESELRVDSLLNFHFLRQKLHFRPLQHDSDPNSTKFAIFRPVPQFLKFSMKFVLKNCFSNLQQFDDSPSASICGSSVWLTLVFTYSAKQRRRWTWRERLCRGGSREAATRKSGKTLAKTWTCKCLKSQRHRLKQQCNWSCWETALRLLKTH